MKATLITPLLAGLALGLPLGFLSATDVASGDPPALVDFPSFRHLIDEVDIHRANRRVSLERFLEMSQEKDTITLDTRSEKAFKQKHLKGAVHLNFSDFTEDKLAKVIPEKTTRILIYCNNNVRNDLKNFAPKSGPLALNIPTYLNLYGYGYKNVFELDTLVAVDDPRWEFEGTEVAPKTNR